MSKFITCYECRENRQQSANNFAYCVDCERMICERHREAVRREHALSLARRTASTQLPAFLDAGPEVTSEIRSLSVENELLSDNHLRRLANLPCLENLVILSFKACSIGAASVVQLMASPYLHSLQSLCLAGNPLGSEGIRAVVGSANLNALIDLDLSETGLTDDAIRYLINSPYAGQLSKLRLDGNAIGDAGTKLLASAGHLRELTTLSLASNRIGDSGVLELARSKSLPNLVSLTLAGYAYGEESFRPFVDPTNLASLVELRLGPDPISLELWQSLIGRFGAGLYAIPRKRTFATPPETGPEDSRNPCVGAFRIPADDIRLLNNLLFAIGSTFYLPRDRTEWFKRLDRSEWQNYNCLLDAFQHLRVREGCALTMLENRFLFQSTRRPVGIDLTHPDVVGMEPLFVNGLPPMPEGLVYFGADSESRMRRLKESEIPPIPEWVRFDVESAIDDDGSAMALFERSILLKWMHMLANGESLSPKIIADPQELSESIPAMDWNPPIDPEEVNSLYPRVDRTIPIDHPLLRDYQIPEFVDRDLRVVDCVRYVYDESLIKRHFVQQADFFAEDRLLWSDQKLLWHNFFTRRLRSGNLSETPEDIGNSTELRPFS